MDGLPETVYQLSENPPLETEFAGVSVLVGGEEQETTNFGSTQPGNLKVTIQVTEPDTTEVFKVVFITSAATVKLVLGDGTNKVRK